MRSASRAAVRLLSLKKGVAVSSCRSFAQRATALEPISHENLEISLRSLLNPPSSSTSSSNPNDEDLLAFVQPLLASTECGTDPGSLLDQLERGLTNSGFDTRNTLPLSLAAALLILDIRTGRNITSRWSLPPLAQIIAYSKTQLGFRPDILDSAKLDALQSIDTVDKIDSSRLFAQISRYCNKGGDAGLRAVWDQHKTVLLAETTHLAKRDEIMARILSACLRCKRNFPSTNLRDTIHDIITSTPKPFPTPILNVLLAHRANSDEFNPSGKDTEGIDERVDDPSSAPSARPNGTLRQTWTTAKSQGAQVDVRSYMIYMEGLGKLGDIEELQKAWEELLVDEHCRQTHQGSYPPVIAFNHMLSCALLVPKTGPPVALQLFERAIQSGSEINIITINTVLRHHARMADIPAMNSLFALAAKLNLQPDVVTYTTLVQGLLRAGKVDMAKDILARMLAQGLEPNERLCSLLVADLARSGSQVGLQRAEEMMSEMRRKGMKITEVTWTSLISGYFRGGWEQDAWAAVDRMKRGGWSLNRVGYNMILKQGKGAWSLKILEQMISEGIKPNSDTFAIVLMPLVTSRQWNEADRVIGIMREFGFRAEKGALAKLVKRAELRR